MSYKMNVFTGKFDLTGFPYGTRMRREGNTVTLSIDNQDITQWVKRVDVLADMGGSDMQFMDATDLYEMG